MQIDFFPSFLIFFAFTLQFTICEGENDSKLRKPSGVATNLLPVSVAMKIRDALTQTRMSNEQVKSYAALSTNSSKR